MVTPKSKYQIFSETTQLAGFIELYTAKSKFWKTFWVVIIIASLTVTAYQVYQAAVQYFQETTVTNIEPLAPDNVEYPPLKMCVGHWLDWVDWKEAFNLNFSIESVLYGMTFLGKVYTTRSFDPDVAKSDFLQTLKRNNISSLTDFYTLISKPYPDGKAGFRTSANLSNLFTSKEVGLSELSDEVCLYYVVSSQKVLENVDRRKKTQYRRRVKNNVLSFRIAYEEWNSTESELSKEEYELNLVEWIERNFQIPVNKLNSHNIILPRILLPNGYDRQFVTLQPDTIRYPITFQASLSQFKNTRKNPCIPGVRTTTSNNAVCLRKCNLGQQYLDKSEGCIPFFSVVSFNITVPIDSICSNDIVFVPWNQSSIWNTTFFYQTSSANSVVQARNYTKFIPSQITNDIYSECADKCGTFEGCERWSYHWEVSSSWNLDLVPQQVKFSNGYVVHIEYPADGTVLVLTQSNFQTWENFVGSVGGLLGIWSGASILSFIHIVYVFCCSQCTFRNFCKSRPKSRDVATQFPEFIN